MQPSSQHRRRTFGVTRRSWWRRPPVTEQILEGVQHGTDRLRQGLLIFTAAQRESQRALLAEQARKLEAAHL
ncbi:hypothetical protein Areg01_85600 [Actinoplanes regularis]|nr:hypothetical protein Areg01_85600 [Actinoplanes regularis]